MSSTTRGKISVRRFQANRGFRSMGGNEAVSGGTGLSLQRLLKQARSSGQLNLSDRGLGTVPDSVWRINSEAPEDASSDVKIDLQEEDRWWEQSSLTKLLLASNSLTELHDDIKMLAELNVLDLHDNKLQKLPSTVNELQLLRKINLSRNEFTVIPQDVVQLKNLQYLYLSHNQLMELPDTIGQLSLLEELDVSENKLTSLSSSVCQLTHLFKLNISKNFIVELPDDVGSLQGLRCLDCAHNNLNQLPNSIGKLEKLEELLVQHNNITHLPTLEGCIAIKELNAGNNFIAELTVEHLENICGVSILNIADNKLTILPDEIVILQRLERLDLSNNDLTALPNILGTLPNLTSLLLEGNSLKSIRRDVMLRGTQELKKFLRSRIEGAGDAGKLTPRAKEALSRRSFNSPGGALDSPDKVRNLQYDMKTSQTMNWSNKNSLVVPSELWDCAKVAGVKKVELQKNVLDEWPDRLQELSSSLAEVNISHNSLSCLPSSAGCLTRLQFLELSSNKLTSLPDELSSLQSLRELNICLNKFAELPCVIGKLAKLEILLAADNQLACIPVDMIAGLKVLATLDLQNNNISAVPPELGNCQQLNCLLLVGNSFRQPRPTILAKGTPSLLEYLRGRIPT